MQEETKIEMKLEEETKGIKKVCEKLEEVLKHEFEKGIEKIDTKEAGEVVDMIKDLYEAKEKLVKSCYYTYILKSMEKEKTEEKEYQKIMEKMREEYGDEDEDMERRFYRGQPRSLTSGRYIKRNDGRRKNIGRRGYMSMYMPEMYRDDVDWDRDMDRIDGRMYYSDGGSGMNADSSGNASKSSNTSGGYSAKGYSDGYSDGYKQGEVMNRRDMKEGKSGQKRKYYMESKELHSDNTTESKQHRMKDLEEFLKSLTEDIAEMIGDASAEERALMKQKLQGLAQKIA